LVKQTHILIRQSSSVREAKDIHTVVDRHYNVILGAFDPLAWDLVWDVLTSSDETSTIYPYNNGEQFVTVAAGLIVVTGRSPDTQSQAVLTDISSAVLSLETKLEDLADVYTRTDGVEILHTARRQFCVLDDLL